MTTIPKYILIGTVRFTVEVTPDTELWRRSRLDLLGREDYKTATLSIREGMPQDVEAQVLMHEIFHALESAGGFTFTEKEIRGMNNGLFQILRQNPQLVEYIVNAGREEPS